MLDGISLLVQEPENGGFASICPVAIYALAWQVLAMRDVGPVRNPSRELQGAQVKWVVYSLADDT